MSKRKEFSDAVKRKLAQAAMHICSNQECLRLTGYETTKGDVRAIAEAAHILPAADGGPRADLKVDAKELRKESNGIWLCLGCHHKCDVDPAFYNADTLRKWKTEHSALIRKIVGKDLETALVDLRNAKRYVDECRELLSFMDGRRMLYVGLDKEFPPRVLQSLEIMKARITQTRGKIMPDSGLWRAVGRMQTAADNFLAGIDPSTDLSTLKCDSGDPVWCQFAKELERFRKACIVILQHLAEDSGYKLQFVGAYGVSADDMK